MLGTIMPPTNTHLVTLGKEMPSSDGHYLEYTAAGVRYLERNYCKVLFFLGAQYPSLCSLVPIARSGRCRWGGLHLGCGLLDRAARQRPAPGGPTLRRRLLWIASDLDSESLSSSQSRISNQIELSLKRAKS